MASGLPFFTLSSFDLGPIELQPFGILVAIGVLFGSHLIHRRADRLGLNDDNVRSLIGWAAVGGFIGAHVFDVLAYQFDAFLEDPLLLLKIWSGISSYGGFIGGTVGFLIYVRRHGLPIAPYADTIMWGLVPGFTFGRMGCTIVHDHIGAASDGFFLATNYPAEVAAKYGIAPGLHHNLGFYELLYMLGLCGVLWLVDRKPHRHGMLVAVIATLYAPVRFFLEFLRVNPAADPRYAGLTFAQWVSIVTTMIGLVWLVRLLRMPADEAAMTPAAAVGARAAAGGSKQGAGSKQSAGGKRGRKK